MTERLDAPGGLDRAMAAMANGERYKLLTGLVVPRPIALVTTLSPGGQVNAAPFSFFNVFSEDPPLVILGLQSKGQGALKDTTGNVRRTGDFVVNLVSEEIAEQMNLCANDFPPEIGELETVGLTPTPSQTVAPPAIAEAPAALECRQFLMLNVTPERDLLIGEVLHARAQPGVVHPEALYTDLDRYRPVGRLFADLYSRQHDRFALTRETYDPARHSR